MTPTVSDVMHPGVVSCPPQATITEVARLMADQRIHPVVVHGLARGANGGERLVWGAIADRDLVAAAYDKADCTASELATTELVAVDPTDTLDEASRLMTEHDLSHLLVVDGRTREPVGIVSTLDLARAIAGAG
jgi:CBS domain-containing protein